MRKMGMRLALLGGFAGAALLAGCNDNPYDFGRKWSLSAQEDYYSEEAQNQDPAARARSNVGSSTTLLETDEQARGTGGGGEADANAGQDTEARSQGEKQGSPDLWLKQDMRVPYPPPQLDALVAMDLGTGKPLKVGRNGAWIQGLHSVELGSGLATSASSTSSSLQPQEPPKGNQALPNEPASDAPRSPKGQIGQPPAPEDE